MSINLTRYIDEPRRFQGFSVQDISFVLSFAFLGVGLIGMFALIPSGVVGVLLSKWISHKNKKAYIRRWIYWNLPLGKHFSYPIPESYKRYFL